MLIKNELYLGDCLELLPQVEDKSVNLIISDLPFSMTGLHWDKLLPIDILWQHYKRVLKDGGTVVMFGSQPFTASLVEANREWFKYELIWVKHQATNPAFAKKGILKCHENILIFYERANTYNPQFEYDKPYSGFSSRIGKKVGKAYNEMHSQHRDNPTGERYPVSFLYFPNPNKGKIHENQKPRLLYDYLIKTYSNQGDVILDHCFGSGNSLLSARGLGRKFIGIEKEERYFLAAQERLIVND